MATTEMMIEALVDLRRDPSSATFEHFWLLMERFRADLVNQAVAIIGNQSDGEDVAQESLCEAFQELDELRDPRKVGSWLRSINRYNALNLRRKRDRERARIEKLDRPTPLVRKVEPDLERVARAVDSLQDIYREVVVLRFWEKRDTQEIASLLAIPQGTVKSRLSRADTILFNKLRPHLKQENEPVQE